ncbi:glyoxalase [Edaphobacter acidisoli]|uniref:Glyoxalase n=1 Tax=Edaphobacter acidisoli TaxID=2040573 RepID=A0A916S2E4_9BACT|nr:VOC family protein [Edaphobacter acidisoli]GGA78800.1 glyoxalase [Edaphobacter acidisoli]
MTTLNHLNLATSNVPELTRFFQTGFGFNLMAQRGNGNFNLLAGEDGFILALLNDKSVTPQTYPSTFHVGFLVVSTDKVREHHRLITEAGFDAPAPGPLQQGGRNAYGFYCHAPGGVMVEVSAQAD